MSVANAAGEGGLAASVWRPGDGRRRPGDTDNHNDETGVGRSHRHGTSLPTCWYAEPDALMAKSCLKDTAAQAGWPLHHTSRVAPDQCPSYCREASQLITR